MQLDEFMTCLNNLLKDEFVCEIIKDGNTFILKFLDGTVRVLVK